MNENKKVVIYTSSLCGFCYKAKVLLSNYNIEFCEINIDNDHDQRKEMILKANGKTTVPQIFLGSEHIGGCDDLYEIARENKLEIFIIDNYKYLFGLMFILFSILFSILMCRSELDNPLTSGLAEPTLTFARG